MHPRPPPAGICCLQLVDLLSQHLSRQVQPEWLAGLGLMVGMAVLRFWPFRGGNSRSVQLMGLCSHMKVIVLLMLRVRVSGLDWLRR